MNSFDVVYNGGRKSRKLQYQFDESKGTVFARNDLSVEYRMSEAGINDGTSELLNEHYSIPHYKCLGRKMRIKDNDKWYWYMADGSLKLIEQERRKQVNVIYLKKSQRFHTFRQEM